MFVYTFGHTGLTFQEHKEFGFFRSMNTGVYRSQSFCLEFVVYSYTALYFFYLSLSKNLYRVSILSGLLLTISIAALLVSLGMSAIISGVIIATFLMVINVKRKATFIFPIAIICMLIVLLPVINSFVQNNEHLFYRFSHINLSEGSGHKFMTLTEFANDFKFFGHFILSAHYEHEYYDAFYRYGMVFGSIYITECIYLLFSSIRLFLYFKKYREALFPVMAMLLSFIPIGSAHHTVSLVISNVIIFSSFGVIQNMIVKEQAIIAQNKISYYN
jgi:hypothetical protein